MPKKTQHQKADTNGASDNPSSAALPYRIPHEGDPERYEEKESDKVGAGISKHERFLP
jgi:hypothetical protein